MDVRLPGSNGIRVVVFAIAFLISTRLFGFASQTPASTSQAVPATQAAASSTPAPGVGVAPAEGAASSATKASSGTVNPAISAAAGNKIAGGGPDANTAGDSSLLKLGAGDLLDISVYNIPELTTKARVGNSGDVYLPLIDYVHLGGLTVDEAQTVIQKRLEDGGFVRSPHVTIFVDESTSQGVTMLGEISRPGIYPDLGDRTLYEMISQAGGFTATAARKVSIARRNQAEPINLTLPRNLADDMSKNVGVQPGDTIMVPRAPVVYVVGDVGHPSGLLIDNGTLTVMQAIALAGGANRTAKLGGVRIVRKNATGVTETTVPLKKMLEAKAPDVQLQADDILFVPISGAKYMAGRTLDVAISLASAVTLYAVAP